MELGLSTFADIGLEPGRGGTVSGVQRMKNLLEEATLADELGLDVFAVGEHHRPDFVASSPAVILGAIAALTERVRLSSAVTVLSSADPVRVFEEFAEVDLLSGGRAEIMAGRGSFTESFPLFGYDLDDYDDLFAEHLELLLRIRAGERVEWEGKHRPSISGLGVYPRPAQDPLPVWIAVGGTPQSVARAGLLGLPVMLAIIGGTPERFAPLAELHREAARRAGFASLPFGTNSHTYVAADSKHASTEFFGAYSSMMNRIGRERGWPPMRREQFEAGRGPGGHLLVGNPEEVAEKILLHHELFASTRFLAQISVGTLAHDKVMRAIELFGTKVAPLVREEVTRRTAEPAPAA
jgi:probable LLM family oxidoreductase